MWHIKIFLYYIKHVITILISWFFKTITDSLKIYNKRNSHLICFLFPVDFSNLSSTRAWTIVLDGIERAEGSPSMVGGYRVSSISRKHVTCGCYRGWSDGKIDVQSLLLLVRRRGTRTTGKMWTYGHPTLSVWLDSMFSVVSSIRSVGHSAWTTSAVSYIFIR